MGSEETRPVGDKQNALKEALEKLVDDGTITLAQADAVRQALREVRKSRAKDSEA